jgi:glycosyltransferase involved in cell wall biosynthesis
LVDPTSVDDIAEKMGMIYKDENLRRKLVSAAAVQAAKFDWDNSADQLWQSMMRCLPAGK